MTTPRAGRPIGSGLDDEAALDAIEALMAAEPELSMRAAIVRISGDEGADIRRMQRKLGFRVRARDGDARRILVGTFEHGDVREGRLWTRIVDVPMPGAKPFAVVMGVFVGKPILEVVDPETELPIPFGSRSDHPIVVAIGKLQRGYGWDDPSFMICCERLGFDPSRERPMQYDTQDAAASAIFHPDVSIAAGDQHEPEFTFSLEELEAFASNRSPEPGTGEAARIAAREATLRNVELAMAFENLPDGTHKPERLSELHYRCRDAVDEAGHRAAEDARDAFHAIDWARTSVVFADLRWLANPWEFDHHASVYLCGTDDDGLSCWPEEPLFVAPLRRGDLIQRRAALAAERNFMTLVLSEQEMANFEAGGDRAYWSTMKDWNSSAWTRLKTRWTAPDLQMTRALIDAMVHEACEAYVSRSAGKTLDPKALLSCEMRATIQPSRPLTFLQVVRREIAGRWHRSRFVRLAARGACYPHVRDGRLEMPWGDCFIGRADGRIVVRPGTQPLSCDGRLVRLSVDLIESIDGRHIPLVASDSFEATDLDTGEAIPVETLRKLMKVVATAGVLVPPTSAGRSVPLRRRIGWAAAGFGTCLLAIGALSAPGGAGNRMRDLPRDTMPVYGGAPQPTHVGPSHVPKAP